jgi:triosephosphate isomerase
MPRRILIAANWKMTKKIAEADSFVRAMKPALGSLDHCDLLIFPPFFALPAVAAALEDSPVGVGAQDLFWEEKGAYTGEISGEMIGDAGGSWVLVGHSERRHVIGETDKMIQKKLAAAYNFDLKPILCVGETLEQREAGKAQEVVKEQIKSAIDGLDPSRLAQLVIAYEPVWAIGTGKTATPDDAEEMHALVRGLITETAGSEIAQHMIIQYGGSVKPDNAANLLEREHIDGALIGGASLEVDSFIAIAQAAPGSQGRPGGT